MDAGQQIIEAAAACGMVARRFRAVGALALVLLACLLGPASASGAPYDTLVSSRSSGDGPPDAQSTTGDGGPSSSPVSYSPVISSDGRYVAFGSRAFNLVVGDLNLSASGYNYDDVFVRDHGSSPPTTTLVSRASDSAGLPGAQTNQASYPTSISPDGRFVVFTSSASNLAVGDTNGGKDVFVRDRDPDADGDLTENNATTTLVSRATGVGPPAGGRSDNGQISADGRHVAFFSEATDLVAGGQNGGVFVRDLAANTTVAVSRPDGAGPSLGGEDPSISADGRYVAFTGPSDLLGGVAPPSSRVFVRDLVAATTALVSLAGDGSAADGLSRRPALSADGRFVAFESNASNLTGRSASQQREIFVRDRQADTTTLVTRAVSGETNGGSGFPLISADGRFVAFHSGATNLVEPATNAGAVFVRDLQERSTTAASRASGADGALASIVPPPALAAGAGFVAFASRASNLVANDLNALTDVFRRELAAPPAPPSVSIGDVTVGEGDSGVVDARFTLTLSRAIGQAVLVDFETKDGTATAGADYVGASGTATIAAGQTTVTVTVQVNGDTLDEADEQFFVNLLRPRGATIADGQGVGTITDDDDAVPVVSVGDVSVSEGDVGELDATFAVSLSGPAGRATSVDFATADDTALAPGDYASVIGTLGFAVGETSKTVTVKVKGDTVPEFPLEERFLVHLSNPQALTIGDGEGVGTITDNDASGGGPRVSIGDTTVIEGDTGTAQASFEVSLSAPGASDVIVDFATANGSATASADYEPKSGVVTIPAGQTARTVSVAVAGDVVDEPDELFLVNLADARGATVGVGQGAGTITDDDASPTVSVADTSVTEGDSGEVVASLTVLLSAASGRVVTVGYATADDTATAPGDYQTKSGRVSFAPGDRSKTITVAVAGDLLDEDDERFVVRLADPVAAGVADGEGVATIADNDALPALDVGDVTVTEGDAGEVAASFTVSLSAPSGRPVTVELATADESAIAPGDYEPKTATVVFAAGQTTRTVAVNVKGDTLDEPDERFLANLAKPADATITDGRATATIIDDDAPPTTSPADTPAINSPADTPAINSPGNAPPAGGGPGDPPRPGAPIQARDLTRPQLTRLSISRDRFRAARSGASSAAAVGSRVSYGLSETASVRFFVQRAFSGWRVAGRCVKGARSRSAQRRCTGYETLRGGFSVRGREGANTFMFTGRLRARALRPGRYRLRAVATDAAGNRSVVSSRRFEIVLR